MFPTETYVELNLVQPLDLNIKSQVSFEVLLSNQWAYRSLLEMLNVRTTQPGSDEEAILILTVC